MRDSAEVCLAITEKIHENYKNTCANVTKDTEILAKTSNSGIFRPEHPSDPIAPASLASAPTPS